MAHSHYNTLTVVTLTLLTFMSTLVNSQPPPLDPKEQEAVYSVLESINPSIPWRSLFPDDLCTAAPHGVVCDYFSDTDTPHVVELSFGYVSDYSPNPPCFSNSTLDPSLLAPLSHLKKIFFYKCFTETKIPFPDFSRKYISSSLQELVFIENPGLVGSLGGKLSGLVSLRRLVLTGGDVSEVGSGGFGELVNLEELTLSRNRFKGEIFTMGFENMTRLKVLDLSGNGFHGNVPESIDSLTGLLKVDLSHNGFSGRLPEGFKNLKSLEFLDLSYNKFGNFGVPLFLGEMHSLREVYLSGNFLGGLIPEIWGNLGGILRIGLSGVGLVGNIPKSMGVHLRNVCYLGLDNNALEGAVPHEFGGLELLGELNLENNGLSGKVPFSAGFVSRLGKKLKLGGNLDLCVDEGLRSAKVSADLGQLKVCREQDVSRTALVFQNSCPKKKHAASVLTLMSVGVLVFFGLRRPF